MTTLKAITRQIAQENILVPEGQNPEEYAKLVQTLGEAYVQGARSNTLAYKTLPPVMRGMPERTSLVQAHEGEEILEYGALVYSLCYTWVGDNCFVAKKPLNWYHTEILRTLCKLGFISKEEIAELVKQEIMEL